MARTLTQGHPDHDSCGTGFVTQLGAPPTHEVVSKALVALQRLSHRGGLDADGSSGDGAGLLTAIPQQIFRRWAKEQDLSLPEEFAVGMVFVAAADQELSRVNVEALAQKMGLRCLGWREVPTCSEILGPRAIETLPAIWQCLFAADNECPDLERLLFLFRKRAETELNGVYFCSLSARTIVYKGLLAPWQLPLFYPDLADSDFKSRFAIFHQRYSTNTQPSWSLAQPFRYLAHNGEINTVVGNRRWMCAREPEIRRELHADGSFRCLEAGVSDSASLDNALEILIRQGKSPEAAVLSLMPPVFGHQAWLTAQIRGYLESISLETEPWDGPAALVFSDGRSVGAKLDRNGLRPLRYTRSSDGWLVLGSEVGIADFEGSIVERGRLGPGEMLVVDTFSGTLLRNRELLRTIANSFGDQDRPRASLESSRDTRCLQPVAEPKRLAAAMGWTEDQFRLLFQPLTEGKEAVWSMGDDSAPAFLSALRRPLWDYCKQRFAQVTNPPIDPLREAHVMSLATALGCDVVLDSPVLDQRLLTAALEKFPSCRSIDITFDSRTGTDGARQALQAIATNIAEAPNASLFLLTDKSASAERAVLPALLATATAWKMLVDRGGYRTPLVIETGQVIETHHLALLIAAGANACFPYLAMQLADELHLNGASNFRKATTEGLRKVLSRMGISSLASYRNSHLFETIGLDQELCAEFFEDAAHFGGGKSLCDVLQDYIDNHQAAFASDGNPLKDAGLYRYRKSGERRSASPELLRKLREHIDDQQDHPFEAFEQIGGSRDALAVRDMLQFVPGELAELDSVVPVKDILASFSTQAMSLGAVSQEVHRTLAVAMNRLGGRSNTGEGGEDPHLYHTDPEATSRTKQVASARFGVTAEYLVHAREIEIKISQGAKPGEGGQLPAGKVTPYIARLRHAVPGMALISPAPHHDIYSIEDLAQLIYDLREVNPEARIGVKLVSGSGVGIIAAGVAKAGADIITISGHDGGTGAAALTSIKNTGLPWEFGLRDAHRTLILAGLRNRVRLRVDGGLKLARDVVIGALLGADEFGFGTAALLAIGCIMARQCHLNTCPVGIATQDETLRARFTGKPEMVMAYFQALAQAVRELLASIGATSLAGITGDAGRVRPTRKEFEKSLDGLLLPIAFESKFEARTVRVPGKLHAELNRSMVAKKSRRVIRQFKVCNADRSLGANLSGQIASKAKSRGDGRPVAEFEFSGRAGQSFGAFLVSGLLFRLHGEANDYVGKGLSGGTIAIGAGTSASKRGDVLAGNTLLYGATAGELYLSGRAGERFAVRNSGALAVVEGVGDHLCEYMTGGVVLNLGAAGTNVGAGMTGGLAYMTEEFLAGRILNPEFVRFETCSNDEQTFLRRTLTRHHELTGSPHAARLLSHDSLPLVRIQPLTLPCPVEQTWQPLLERLPAPQENLPTVGAAIAGSTISDSA